MTRMRRGILAGLAGLLLSPLPARAQRQAPQLVLPATPLNRPPATGEITRIVTITQENAEGGAIGKPLELRCTETGCQGAMELLVEGRAERFTVGILFVDRGAYVTVEPVSLGNAQVVEFQAAHAGPAFILLRGRDRVARLMRYVVLRDASARSVARSGDGNTLAEGNVFGRKLEPDLLLQVDFARPG
ncbi:MAG TPA: hypothetical protein VGC80_05620 [Acetobacteraceae bacterium]